MGDTDGHSARAQAQSRQIPARRARSLEIARRRNMIGHVWGKALRIAGFVVLGVVGAAVFALIFGWFVMLLWNWLMPAIFHLGEITFWQAFGIIILAKLIFGAVGPGGRHGHGWKGGTHH